MTRQPDRLFGPYGSELARMGVSGDQVRGATVEIAISYLEAGANVATLNTFGGRRDLRAGDEKSFASQVREQRGVVLEAIEGAHKPVREIVASFGPYGDCYRPEEAPSTWQEARDFHLLQAAAASTFGARPWYETFTTAKEAIGAAKASEQFGLRPTISWVLNQQGTLLTGQTVRDAIREVDAAAPGVVRGFGLNCCPAHAVQAAFAQAGESARRIEAIYPNAFDGNPWEAEASGGFHGVVDAKKTAADLVELAQRHGVEIVGGCCGYTPCDVREISDRARGTILEQVA